MSAVQKVLESEEKVSEKYSNFSRVQFWSALLLEEHHIKERSFLLSLIKELQLCNYHGLPSYPV